MLCNNAQVFRLSQVLPPLETLTLHLARSLPAETQKLGSSSGLFEKSHVEWVQGHTGDMLIDRQLSTFKLFKNVID